MAPRAYGSLDQREREKDRAAGTPSGRGVVVGVGDGSGEPSVHAARTSTDRPDAVPARKLRRVKDISPLLYLAGFFGDLRGRECSCD